MSHGIIVINPKFRANVGMILRLSASFEADYFFWTGDRAQAEISPKGIPRLPREERMEEYRHVRSGQYTNNLDMLHIQIGAGFTPVAVEFRNDFESLPTFEHPINAVYVFGSEDKGIPQNVLRACHKFVTIPSAHVLNLATAVAITLYDRSTKLRTAGE